MDMKIGHENVVVQTIYKFFGQHIVLYIHAINMQSYYVHSVQHNIEGYFLESAIWHTKQCLYQR